MIGPKIIGGLTNTSKMPGYSFSLQALTTCNVGAKLAKVEGTPCFYCYAKGNFYLFPSTVKAQERRLESLLEAIDNPDHGQRWSAGLGVFLSDAEYNARRLLKKIGEPSAESMRLYYADQKAQTLCNAGARRILKGGDPTKETEEAQRLAVAARQARAHCEELKANDPEEARRVARFVAWDNARHFRWHDSGDIVSLGHMLLIDKVCRLSPTVAHWLPTQERAVIKAYFAHLKERGLAKPSNLTIRISNSKLDQHRLSPIDGTLASSVSTNGQTPGNLCPAYTQGGNCGACRGCWGDEPLWTYPAH